MTRKFDHTNSGAIGLLIIAAILFFVLSKVPYGHYIQWPFVIVTTFIHEMGHGLTALALGGDFVKVEIYQNASGVAWTRSIPGWRQAAVAAGGLLAPSIAGGIFITAGRTSGGSKTLFMLFSIFVLAGCALWVRSPYGLVVLVPLGLLFITVAIKGNNGIQHFLIQFMGVHMLVDTFTRTLSYLFSSSANVGGKVSHSDTGAIAEQFGGGHALWGLIIATIAVLIFYQSIRRAYLK